MTKGPSPLLGYNTNVRHKGRVFHIQTEDSGITHPHVITHLFADGGRILKSNKTGYAEIVSAPDMPAQVKKIMQDQHKAMFIALRDGQFDHLFENAPEVPVMPHGNPAEQADAMAELRRSQTVTPTTAAAPTASPPSSANIPATPPPVPAAAKPAVPPPVPPPYTPSADGPRRTSSVAMPAVRVPTAPIGSSTPSSSDLSAAKAPARPSSPPRPTGSTPSQRPAAPSQRPTGMSGHYQAVRAPEILGSFKGRESTASQPANIFGDGLMSEKSLDEVILAYLSEDLDDEKR